jgi:hypothetical protein
MRICSLCTVLKEIGIMKKKALIFVYPLSESMRELKQIMEENDQEENVDIFDVDLISEIDQLLPTLGPSLTLVSQPKKCAQMLKDNRKIIKKFQSKVLLLTTKLVSRKIYDKLRKIGLTEQVQEPVLPKTLLFKVRLLLRSLKDIEDTEKQKQGKIKVKTSEFESTSEGDESGLRLEKGVLAEIEVDEDSGSKNAKFDLVIDESGDGGGTKDVDLKLELGESSSFSDHNDGFNALDGGNSKLEIHADSMALDIDSDETFQQHTKLGDLNLEQAKDNDDGSFDLNIEQSVLSEAEKVNLDIEAGTKGDASGPTELDLDPALSSLNNKMNLDDLVNKDENHAKKENVSLDLDELEKEAKAQMEEVEPAAKSSEALGDLDFDLDGGSLNSDEVLGDLNLEEGKSKNKVDEELNLDMDDGKSHDNEELGNLDLEASKKDIEEEIESLDLEAGSSTNEEDVLGELDLEDGQSLDKNVNDFDLEEGEQKKRHQDTELGLEESSKKEKSSTELDLEEVGGLSKNEEDLDLNLESDSQSLSDQDVQLEIDSDNNVKNNETELDLESSGPLSMNEKGAELELEEGDSGRSLEKTDLNLIDSLGGQKDDELNTVKDIDELEVKKGTDLNLDIQSETSLKNKDDVVLDIEAGMQEEKEEKEEKHFDWEEYKKKSGATDDFGSLINKKKKAEGFEDIYEKNKNDVEIDYGQLKEEFEDVAIDMSQERLAKLQGKKFVADAEADKEFQSKKREDEEFEDMDKNSEEEEEEEETKDEVFQPQINGLDIAYEVLQLYLDRTVKDKEILEFLSKRLVEEYSCDIEFVVYDKSSKKYVDQYVSSVELADDKKTEEEKTLWAKRRIEVLDKCSDISIPQWTDGTFRDPNNEFIYPYFEGVDKMGIAHVKFNKQVEEADTGKIEVQLECARGIFLEKYHEYGQSGKYENKKEEKAKKPGFFKKLFSRFAS